MSNKWIYRIGAGLIVAVILYIAFPNSEPNPRPLQWGIHTQGKALSILGLMMHKSQLQDVITTIKSTPDIALFTTRQHQGQPEPAMHLEAYFEDVFDEDDRIIVGLEEDIAFLRQIKQEAYHPELFPNDVIRTNVREEHISHILTLPIHSITIIAGSPVDFDAFKTQFGEPDKMISDGQGNAHFLFPAIGLDFIQPSDGLQVLQFVSPDRFDSELLQPLIQSISDGKKT